jgi:cell division protein FtsX
VSVTGKPSGRMQRATDWYIRWPFILTTYGAVVLIGAL